MTAEVVILNRNGVGIAADSLATLPDPNSSQNIKTYHTQNKLFGLSSDEAVAVMFYGSCYFGPYPWETVIKEYRRDRDTAASTGAFGEYESSIISFLQKIANGMPSHHGDLTLDRVARYELREFKRAFIEAREENRGPMFREYVEQRLIDKLLLHRQDELHQAASINLSEDEANQQVEDSLLADGEWQKVLQDELSDVPISDEHELQMLSIIKLSLRKATHIASHSGLVLTGFGKEDLLPAVSHYWIDGIGNGMNLRYASLSFNRVDDHNDVYILPYAQTEVIDTYLRGIHPHLENYLTVLLGQYLRSHLEAELPSLIEDLVADEALVDGYELIFREQASRDLVEYVAAKVVEDFSSQLDSSVRSSYVSPIESIVRYLPKDGLGEMAEALVGLTSLTRKITPGDETVGGEIDVAVITKGDGLVWLGRKHYFDPALNPRYFERIR